MALLHILKGPNQGQRLTLDQSRITLGRNRDCTVIIDFPAVSRVHAVIRLVSGKFVIEDGDGQGNRSRNKTFVNNQEVDKPRPLAHQDRIKICDFLCVYFDETPAPTQPPGPIGTDTTGMPEYPSSDEPELPDEEPATSTVVEARLGRLSNSQVLEAQPAEKISALLDISTHLSKTLELETLLPKIADCVFQLFKQADRFFLIQREPRDDPAGRLVPRLIKARRPGGEASARFSRTIALECLKTAQAFLSEDASSDSRFAMAQSIADFRIRSVMVAPLCTPDGKAFGIIQLDTQDRSKRFNPEDLRLLIGVANQAAVALELVQMHRAVVVQERSRRDLELAREVQRSFLPQKLPNLAGYQFHAHYEAAQEIGGDYYDFIPLSGGRLAVMLGDVAGKGVAAALFMAKLSAEVRYNMLSCADPAGAISSLNDQLMRNGMLDKFVTLAAVVLDPARHAITVVNAGHMPPLVYRQYTGVLEDAVDPEASGLPVGVMESYQYIATQAELRPGDTIVLFTDGITDAQGVKGDRFEMTGVREALSGRVPESGPTTPVTVGERLIKAVKQHASGKPQYDDIALVTFGRIK